MIRRPPRSTPLYSSAASDVYKRQITMSSAVDWMSCRSRRWMAKSTALRHPAARPAAHPVHGAAHRDHLRGRQPGGRHPVRRSEPAHPVQLTRASARGWGGCALLPAAAATVGLSSWTVAATHRWQNEYSCLDRAASLLK